MANLTISIFAFRIATLHPSDAMAVVYCTAGIVFGILAGLNFLDWLSAS